MLSGKRQDPYVIVFSFFFSSSRLLVTSSLRPSVPQSLPATGSLASSLKSLKSLTHLSPSPALRLLAAQNPHALHHLEIQSTLICTVHKPGIEQGTSLCTPFTSHPSSRASPWMVKRSRPTIALSSSRRFLLKVCHSSSGEKNETTAPCSWPPKSASARSVASSLEETVSGTLLWKKQESYPPQYHPTKLRGKRICTNFCYCLSH